jgi:hypothetical protein
MILQLLLMIAVTLSGECGSMGGNCEVAVARTMANRYVQCGDMDAVLSAYYGRGEPTVRSLAVARLFLAAPGAFADGRYYYVYSDRDRLDQGWVRGDRHVCDVGGMCLNFTAEWPGNRRGQ